MNPTRRLPFTSSTKATVVPGSSVGDRSPTVQDPNAHLIKLITKRPADPAAAEEGHHTSAHRAFVVPGRGCRQDTCQAEEQDDVTQTKLLVVLETVNGTVVGVLEPVPPSAVEAAGAQAVVFVAQ